MDNSTPNMSEKLLQYLDGELTGAEKKNMEQQLATDPSLQAELESLKATSEAVKLYGLQQKVSGIHQQMMGELQAPVKKISSRKKIVRYSIAVAASVILIVAGMMAYNFYSLSSSKVFASNYRSYELSITRDGGNELTPAEKAYSEKNYREVLRIHDAGEDKTAKGEFLCGAASLELENNSMAIKCFKEVLDINKQSATVVLQDETEYYLALSYLRNKEYDLALELMREIKDNPAHLYHEKMTGKLIRQVKMLKRR